MSVVQSKGSAARQFFSRQGVLSRWHPNYEYRPGQLAMAEAVETALRDERHLIVEAGTGTGKTLAYLIPAILSGKRVVISTGTKNLQEQLFFKDVPFLQKHLPTPARVCYMKGRNNYACRQKIYDADRTVMLAGMEEVADFQIIREWETTTGTGDRAELRTLPEASGAWTKIDARRDLCSGTKCTQFERCFLTLMHQRALESDIIIVNHHLFFADLALKDEEFGQIIPPYDAVILDEAHEVEDVAGQYFGVSVSNAQLDELRRDILAVARSKNFGSEELDRILVAASELGARFFASFGEIEGRAPFCGHAPFLQRHHAAYVDFLRAVELIALQLSLVKSGPEEILPLCRRAQDYLQRLRWWMEDPQSSFVYWVERRGRSLHLQATPIEVSSLLGQALFDKCPSVILTSATLAVAGSFDYAAQRLGVGQARTLVVDSPFSYRDQALLYVPQRLPDPRSPGFAQAAAEEVIKLLHLSQGRAFVLCTSTAQMRLLYDLVSTELKYPLLLQGSAPKSALLDQFRSTPHCTLFATSSFWQGVDVRGDQLSCVIIDRLPFAVPNDPVVAARMTAVREAGGEPFYQFQIPQAALTLKQGLGRLIRSQSDRGVLCVLDNRITKQRYGQVFFDSLPDYSFTTKLEDVEQFFAALNNR